MNKGKPVQKSRTMKIKVWGDFACFTRPEMKVERVSYDVMTPSAARGIVEAILWKPAIRWRIERIDVLQPIRWISVRRNELESKIPYRNITSSMESLRGNLGIYIEDERQQRAGLFLRDVAYVIHASFEMTDRAGESDNVKKFEEMFERRVKNGQYHHTPCFGNREFAVFFGPADDSEQPIPENKDLGYMLYDMDFESEEIPALFFRAEMKSGSIKIPEKDSLRVVG